MKYLLAISLFFFASPFLAKICGNKVVINSSDSYTKSAIVYIVCPEFDKSEDADVVKYVNDLENKYKNLANELFIQFLYSAKHIGYMEKAPYKIPESELIADFYNGTGRLYFWPGTSRERFLKISNGLKH